MVKQKLTKFKPGIATRNCKRCGGVKTVIVRDNVSKSPRFQAQCTECKRWFHICGNMEKVRNLPVAI